MTRKLLQTTHWKKRTTKSNETKQKRKSLSEREPSESRGPFSNSIWSVFFYFEYVTIENTVNVYPHWYLKEVVNIFLSFNSLIFYMTRNFFGVDNSMILHKLRLIFIDDVISSFLFFYKAIVTHISDVPKWLWVDRFCHASTGVILAVWSLTTTQKTVYMNGTHLRVHVMIHQPNHQQLRQL